MKAYNIILTAIFTLISLVSFGQDVDQFQGRSKTQITDLPVIYITDNVNLLIRSPEQIQFVDLSTKNLIGDLPTENVGRVKLIPDSMIVDERFSSGNMGFKKNSFTHGQEIGIITLVGQTFMAQYRVLYSDPNQVGTVSTNIEVLPNQMMPLDYPQYELSAIELKRYAMDVLKMKPSKPIRSNKNLKLVSQLNQIYTVGNYVFLDITFLNKSNLAYDIDQLRFSIDDKKVYKSTNVQSIEVNPIFSLYNHKTFKKSFRNVYVFKKFTYPNNKVLNIRMVEDQVSGRTIDLLVQYKDILDADTF